MNRQIYRGQRASGGRELERKNGGRVMKEL